MTENILNIIGIGLLVFHFTSPLFADKLFDWLKNNG